jgi:hypothetical protein
MTAQPVEYRSPVRRGLNAAKANLVPGMILQSLAISILLSYYFYPPAQDFFAWLSEFKQSFGLPFPFFSTALFGAALPFILQFLQSDTSNHERLRYLPILLLYWGCKGIEVEYLYRLQAVVFGEGDELRTVLPKVLFDQMVYSPLWAIPTILTFYAWKDCGFDFSATLAKIKHGFIKNQVIPFVIQSWLIWVPTVVVIYCLPTPLQLPMENIILCLWVLLLVFLSKSSH